MFQHGDSTADRRSLSVQGPPTAATLPNPDGALHARADHSEVAHLILPPCLTNMHALLACCTRLIHCDRFGEEALLLTGHPGGGGGFRKQLNTWSSGLISKLGDPYVCPLCYKWLKEDDRKKRGANAAEDPMGVLNSVGLPQSANICFWKRNDLLDHLGEVHHVKPTKVPRAYWVILFLFRLLLL